MSERQRILRETTQVREKAQVLLRGLIEARSASERHLSEIRQLDPLKRLTGHSSMDNAIVSTRKMIDSLDRALDQLRTELTDDDLALMR